MAAPAPHTPSHDVAGIAGCVLRLYWEETHQELPEESSLFHLNFPFAGLNLRPFTEKTISLSPRKSCSKSLCLRMILGTRYIPKIKGKHFKV